MSLPTEQPGHKRGIRVAARLCWLAGGFGVLGLVCIAYTNLRPPPTHEERSVSSWLGEALQTHGKTNGEASLRALRAIGQPIVPALREHIRSCRPAVFRKYLLSFQSRLPLRFRVIESTGYDADTDLPDLIAVMAELGEVAKPAVAEAVLSLRADNTHFTSGEEMVENLGRMGPAAADAIPYLKELANNWESVRPTVAEALYRIDRQAFMETIAEVGKSDPALIGSLIKSDWLSTDPELRRCALRLLESESLSDKLAAELRQLLKNGEKSGVAP